MCLVFPISFNVNFTPHRLKIKVKNKLKHSWLWISVIIYLSHPFACASVWHCSFTEKKERIPFHFQHRCYLSTFFSFPLFGVHQFTPLPLLVLCTKACLTNNADGWCCSMDHQRSAFYSVASWVQPNTNPMQSLLTSYCFRASMDKTNVENQNEDSNNFSYV